MNFADTLWSVLVLQGLAELLSISDMFDITQERI